MRRELRSSTGVAIVTLIDGHSAVIDRCADGMLTRVRTIIARRPSGETDHMGDAPAPGCHSGTRGETIRDTRNRARTNASQRFIRRVTPFVSEAAADGEWVVLGGNPILVNALKRALPTPVAARVIVADAVHRALTGEALAARVAAAVEAHVAANELADVERLLECTGAHTTGVVGPMATLDAAEHGAADVVLVTPTYREQKAADTERLVATTTSHGGRVEFIAGEAAELLDAKAGGVGALLRFALHAMPLRQDTIAVGS